MSVASLTAGMSQVAISGGEEQERFRRNLEQLSQKIGEDPQNENLKAQFVDLAKDVCLRAEWALLRPYAEILRSACDSKGCRLLKWADQTNSQSARQLRILFGREEEREEAEAKSLARRIPPAFSGDRDTRSNLISCGPMVVENFDSETGTLTARWLSRRDFYKFHQKVARSLAAQGHYALARRFAEIGGGAKDIPFLRWVQEGLQSTADMVRLEDPDRAVDYDEHAAAVSLSLKEKEAAYQAAIERMRESLRKEGPRLGVCFESFRQATQLNASIFEPYLFMLGIAPGLAENFPERAEDLVNRAYEISPIQTFNVMMLYFLVLSHRSVASTYQSCVQLFLKRFPQDLLLYIAINQQSHKELGVANGGEKEEQLRQKFSLHLSQAFNMIRRGDWEEARDEFSAANRLHVTDKRAYMYQALIDLRTGDRESAIRLTTILGRLFDWFNSEERAAFLAHTMKRLVPSAEEVPSLNQCPELPMLKSLIKLCKSPTFNEKEEKEFLEAVSIYLRSPDVDILWASCMVDVVKDRFKERVNHREFWCKLERSLIGATYCYLSSLGADLSDYEGLSVTEDGHMAIALSMPVRQASAAPAALVIDPQTFSVQEKEPFLREILWERYHLFYLIYVRVMSIENLLDFFKVFEPKAEVPLFNPFWSILLERLTEEASWKDRESLFRWASEFPGVWRGSQGRALSETLCGWQLAAPILTRELYKLIEELGDREALIENRELKMAKEAWTLVWAKNWAGANSLVGSFFEHWRREQPSKINLSALRSLSALRVLLKDPKLAAAMPDKALSSYHAEIIECAFSVLARGSDLQPYAVPKETGTEHETRELYRVYIGQRKGENDKAYFERLKQINLTGSVDLRQARRVGIDTDHSSEGSWVIAPESIQQAQAVIQQERDLQGARCAKNEEILLEKPKYDTTDSPDFIEWVEGNEELINDYLEDPTAITEYLRKHYPRLQRAEFIKELEAKAESEKAFRALRAETDAPQWDPNKRFWQIVQQTAALVERVSNSRRTKEEYNMILENEEEARFVMQLIYEWSLNKYWGQNHKSPEKKELAAAFHGPETHKWGKAPRIWHFNAGVGAGLKNAHLFFRR